MEYRSVCVGVCVRVCVRECVCVCVLCVCWGGGMGGGVPVAKCGNIQDNLKTFIISEKLSYPKRIVSLSVKLSTENYERDIKVRPLSLCQILISFAHSDLTLGDLFIC